MFHGPPTYVHRGWEPMLNASRTYVHILYARKTLLRNLRRSVASLSFPSPLGRMGGVALFCTNNYINNLLNVSTIDFSVLIHVTLLASNATADLDFFGGNI